MLEPAAARDGILRSFTGSLVVHTAALALLIRLGPGTDAAVEREIAWRIREATPLVAPPAAPAELRLDDLTPKPRVYVPPPVEAPERPPQPPAPPPPKLPPADLAALPPPALRLMAPPPKIELPEPPKAALEKPSALELPPQRDVATSPLLRRPAVSLEEAIREAARNRGGGVVVGDAEDAGAAPGGVAEMRSLTQAPGRTASNIELLSDAQGVDFRPYLTRILATVRRNWQAVMPESARLGRRGRVAIQLSINREGRIPKLVIAESSGAEPLDRAAVAGITASDPFPPLPEEFGGQEIRIQFNFLYNMR